MHKIKIFFDSGCGEMLVKQSLVEKLISIGRAKQIIPVTTKQFVMTGCTVSVCPYIMVTRQC